jgi:hypothetical protein
VRHPLQRVNRQSRLTSAHQSYREHLQAKHGYCLVESQVIASRSSICDGFLDTQRILNIFATLDADLVVWTMENGEKVEKRFDVF